MNDTFGLMTKAQLNTRHISLLPTGNPNFFLLLVFESPVWSGLFAKKGKTGTKTSPHKFEIPKRLNRTDRDRSNMVLVGLFQSWDRFNM